jgi:hypothetical protein
MRVVLIVIGVLLLIPGVVWTLQGLNILGGSFMSGHIQYTVLGVVVLLIGLALVGVGARRGARSA